MSAWGTRFRSCTAATVPYPGSQRRILNTLSFGSPPLPPLRTARRPLSSRAPSRPIPSAVIYNAPVIAFARGCMTVMTWLFLVGVAGSLLVIVISFVEDLTEIVGKE